MKNYGQNSVSDKIEFSKKGPKIKKILDDLFGTFENNETNLARMQGKDPIDAQDFVTKAFLETGFQIKVAYARALNTDITTDLNTNTGDFVTDVPLFGITETTNGTSEFEFLSETEVQVKFTGSILVLANLHITSNTARTNVNIKSKKNGVPVNGVGATGYIRSTNNHNQSSLHITGIINVVANDIITIGSRQEANNGAVFMADLESSNLSILRLR